MVDAVYLSIGLLLLIVIFALSVFFVSRISKLEAILTQAKAVDRAKEEKLEELNLALQEERANNMVLEKDLEYFEQNKAKLLASERDLASLQERLVEESKSYLGQLHEKERTFEPIRVHYERLQAEYAKQEEALKVLKERNETLVEENNKLKLHVRETEVQIEEQQKQNAQKLQMLQEHRGEIKAEFAQLASKVFEGNSKEFSKLSQENLSTLIKPMESQLSDFKQQIHSFYTDESKERAMLKQEIVSLKELNQQISQDAINLTNALKGEKKQQGIWGEMILEKVLESSGLRKGVEYTREVPLRNEEGKNYRPDVLVHLPDNRDLIIDAKTSLIAYEKYINASDSEPKEIYLKNHIQALSNHVKSLGEKNYDKLLGINTLDFIFMFVPIEGALATALEKDPSLYDYAFKKQILLVGPTTLLIGLRAIENVWKYEKQTQNAKEIASRAGALYDKFVSFSDDMVKLSRQFDTLQGSFESAKKRLSEGKGNIVRQVEQLKEMGAKTSKQIPKELG